MNKQKLRAKILTCEAVALELEHKLQLLKATLYELYKQTYGGEGVESEYDSTDAGRQNHTAAGR